MSGVDSTFIAPHRLRVLASELPDTVPLLVPGPEGHLNGLTYREWDARADQVAAGLLDRGVRVADRIVLLFQGTAWQEYMVAYAAVHRVGATAVHLSPELGWTEVRRRIEEVQPVALLHGPGVELGPVAGVARWAARAQECRTVRGAAVEVDFSPETLSDIFYTSGTTGPAKALCVSHANLGFGRGLNLVAAESFDLEAPIVAPMPLGSSASAGMSAIFALTTSSTIVVCPWEDARQVAATVTRTRAGSLMATPALVMAMVDARVWEQHDLASLTSIGVASAQLPSRYGRALEDHLPNAGIMVTYGGGSEAIPANIRGRYEHRRPGTVGVPSTGTRLRIVPHRPARYAAPSLPDVPPGEPGRVLLTHEAPQRRFLDPTNDAHVYVDGWVVTNDLARITPHDSKVQVLDRAEDAIWTEAGPVSSLSIENALFEHPHVRDAAVVVGRHPPGIVGFVVLDPTSLASAEEVLRVAAEHHPHPTVDQVQVLPGLPRGAQGGKVLKRVLRELGAPGLPVAPMRTTATGTS